MLLGWLAEVSAWSAGFHEGTFAVACKCFNLNVP